MIGIIKVVIYQWKAMIQKYICLGLKIPYYRKWNEMTQEQFAEAIGKSWSFIAQLESTSKVTDVCLETLFKMADVLKIPLSKWL